MTQFIVQRRRVDGLTQWTAGKYGRQYRVSFSPWKTIMKFNTLDDAKTFTRGFGNDAGLEEIRIKCGSKIVWNS